MDAARSVLEDGVVYIADGRIAAVLDAAAPAPDGVANVDPVATGGTIYPRLIELHNHLSYNALTLWRGAGEIIENRPRGGGGRPPHPPGGGGGAEKLPPRGGGGRGAGPRPPPASPGPVERPGGPPRKNPPPWWGGGGAGRRGRPRPRAGPPTSSRPPAPAGTTAATS